MYVYTIQAHRSHYRLHDWFTLTENLAGCKLKLLHKYMCMHAHPPTITVLVVTTLVSGDDDEVIHIGGKNRIGCKNVSSVWVI